MDPLLGSNDPLATTALSPLEAAPRRFALCAEEPDEDGRPEVVGWGLEFDDTAIVYLRDPTGERSTHGVFESADRARALFSLVAALEIVWT